MVAPTLYTYADVVEHLDAFYSGKGRTSASDSDFRRAALAAYETVAGDYDWSFLHRTDERIQLVAPYTTGTITYDSASRALTLATGTWPDWTRDGHVRIADVVSDVESVSGQVATLDATKCPNDDIAAGTSYSLFRRWYPLPNDFKSMDGPMDEDVNWGLGSFVTPQEMVQWTRNESATGNIQRWTVQEIPGFYGTSAIGIDPPSETAQTLDFSCRVWPRKLRYSGLGSAESAGTIVVTAGSQAVAGTDTAFSDDMIGSILRIGTSASRPVTGEVGQRPYAEQRSVIAVAGATALTLDAEVVTSRNGVAYMITDPIDFYRSAWNALLRMAESELAAAKNWEDRGTIFARAERALSKAKAADGGRVTQRHVAGRSMRGTDRLKDRVTYS